MNHPSLKILFFAPILGLLAPIAHADVSSTIELPPGFVAIVWSNVNSVMAGLSGYTTMIIGTILAVLVIVTLIETLRSH